MTSKITLDYKKKKIIFRCASICDLFITVLVLFICIFSRGESSTSGEESISILTTEAMNKLLAVGTTAIIGLGASLLIKDKLRTMLWMCCVIMGTIMFGSSGMYTILFLWLLDEYVFYSLFKYYQSKVSINVELDKRL